MGVGVTEVQVQGLQRYGYRELEVQGLQRYGYRELEVQGTEVTKVQGVRGMEFLEVHTGTPTKSNC